MALLNLTAFTPQIAYSVCATLQSLGGEVERKTLQAWMSPSAVYLDSERPRTLGLGFRESLELCETLELVKGDGGVVTLEHEIGSIEEFRRELRGRVLKPELNVELFEPQPTGGVQAHELTRALAWFLQLPTSQAPYSTANYETYQSGGMRVIENNSRWNVFDRWVVFLGFAWRSADGLLPDPTRAVCDEIEDVLQPEAEIPLPTLVAELAARLPVLDGGAYHRAYLAAVGRDRDWDERRLSEPLSLALMRLQRRGTVEMFGGGDAEARVLRIARDVDRSSQFVRRPRVENVPG